MSEFTGKTRDIYRVRVTLERQRQVEHATEGWINMPADKPETLRNQTVWETEDQKKADFVFNELKDRR